MFGISTKRFCLVTSACTRPHGPAACTKEMREVLGAHHLEKAHQPSGLCIMFFARQQAAGGGYAGGFYGFVRMVRARLRFLVALFVSSLFPICIKRVCFGMVVFVKKYSPMVGCSFISGDFLPW